MGPIQEAVMEEHYSGHEGEQKSVSD